MFFKKLNEWLTRHISHRTAAVDSLCNRSIVHSGVTGLYKTTWPATYKDEKLSSWLNVLYWYGSLDGCAWLAAKLAPSTTPDAIRASANSALAEAKKLLACVQNGGLSDKEKEDFLLAYFPKGLSTGDQRCNDFSREFSKTEPYFDGLVSGLEAALEAIKQAETEPAAV